MPSWADAEPTDEQKASIRDLVLRLNDLVTRATAAYNPTGRRFSVDVHGSQSLGSATGPEADLDLVVHVSVQR